MTFDNDKEHDRFRFEAACAALTGLLADTEDQADERQQEEREVEEKTITGVYYSPVTGQNEPTYRVRIVKKMVYTETCAEATARLAVEHADALLRALK